MDGASEHFHGTAIAAGGRAVLIRGPSGSGKSDLALRAIAAAETVLNPHRAALLSDDQVFVTLRSGRLMAKAPSTIFGKIEIRGIGILTLPAIEEAELVLAADLTAAQDIERMPDPALETEILGCRIPLIRLASFEASAPIKLLAALALFGRAEKKS